MNKKIIVSSAVVLVIVVSFVLWQKMTKTEKLGGSVTIGALVPITGNLTVIGQSMRNGMEMAKQELVSAGVVKNLNIILLVLFILSAIAMVSFWIIHSITVPVRLLSVMTQKISVGNLDARVALESHDELGQFGSSLKKVLTIIN